MGCLLLPDQSTCLFSVASMCVRKSKRSGDPLIKSYALPLLPSQNLLPLSCTEGRITYRSMYDSAFSLPLYSTVNYVFSFSVTYVNCSFPPCYHIKEYHHDIFPSTEKILCINPERFTWYISNICVTKPSYDM